MTEPLVILAVEDGVAHGPYHHPAPTRAKKSGNKVDDVPLEKWTAWNNGFPPSWWPTVCGEKGWLYADVPLVTDDRGECFKCRVAALQPDRHQGDYAPNRGYTDQERLEARRKSWRESKQRRAKERAA